jgi:hypothetical protein
VYKAVPKEKPTKWLQDFGQATTNHTSKTIMATFFLGGGVNKKRFSCPEVLFLG